MIKWLKGLFEPKENIDFKLIYKNGATILDVRTQEEFSSGHIPGSVCIPLQDIELNPSKVENLNQPIIACCRSGRRSGIATQSLRKLGIEIFNGGGWKELSETLGVE